MAALATAQSYVVSLDDVMAARERIRSFGVDETPIHTSQIMNSLSGHNVFYKCELFQKTGSFKARGATNACAKLPQGKTVVTHSSGNHAQAIAFAAKATGRSATIIMPSNAPLPKRLATAGYGAEIRLCEPSARAATAEAAAVELNAELVHPSEHPDVIAGQGTVALEVLEQVAALLGPESCPPEGGDGPLDVLVVPVGGGGLVSGCAVACKALWPRMLVVGAEPEAMDDALRSKQRGEVLGNPPLVAGGVARSTVADGLRTTLGPNTWPVVRDLVDEIVTVSEEDILSATALVWSRMKLQIEPSAGVGAACVLGEKLREIIAEHMDKKNESRTGANGQTGRSTRVGVILCGGNVDAVALAPLLGAAPPYPTGSIAN
mmetsp:Transcript_88157/g.176315  ORF Transcript_88157/g.176315 Transcript_88157/m.176315 type:complete len:377 (+) Transcript_88157:13-1143(+)